ncbi:hypothetical protein P7C73_g2866, partial [Tremellales sp. Uapishka_1]
MSSTTEQAISNINLTGGFPSSKDLAPSIIFLVLYVVTLPVLGYRIFRWKHRSKILIRPTIFVVFRITMLVLRAVMSKITYGEGLLIAELVFVSVGYLFLLEPLVSLWELHVASAVATEDRPSWVHTLVRVLRVVLLATIGTAVAGAALISNAISDPSDVSTVTALRKSSAILALVVVVIALAAIVRTHLQFGLDVRGTAYLLGLGAWLVIVAVYRVVQTFATSPTAPVKNLAVFWTLGITCEFFAYLMIIGISIPSFFPANANHTVGKERHVEMGRTGPSSR